MLENITDVKFFSRGFVVHAKGLPSPLHVTTDTLYTAKEWKAGFHKVLTFKVEGKLPMEESESDYNEQVLGKMLHEGPLTLDKDSKPRYVQLYTDRMEIFKDHLEAKSGPKVSKTVKLPEMQELIVTDTGFRLKTYNNTTGFLVMNDDIPKWLNAWSKVFCKQLTQKSGKSGSAKEPKESAASRIIHQGSLYLMSQGKEEAQHFVIYDDRIEYFDKAADVASGEQKGQIRSTDIKRAAITEQGFRCIVNSRLSCASRLQRSMIYGLMPSG